VFLDRTTAERFFFSQKHRRAALHYIKMIIWG
jgi:hypothetical protein